MFDSTRDPVLEEQPGSRSSSLFFTVLLAAPMLFVLALVIMGIAGELMPPRPPPKIGGLAVGKPAPAIEASGWFNEDSPRPDDYRGKVTVLIAWATWCEPCRRETPELVALYEKFRDQGVVFVGLTRESIEARPQFEGFIDRFKIPWLIGYGADKTLDAFKSDPIPALWVIGPEGTVVWNIESDGTPEDGIKQALAQVGRK